MKMYKIAHFSFIFSCTAARKRRNTPITA